MQPSGVRITLRRGPSFACCQRRLIFIPSRSRTEGVSTMVRKAGFVASVAMMAVLAFAPASAQSVGELEAAARKEGAVNSLGMPDDWANWKDTWAQLSEKYGLKHVDTDMSSAEEIAKFEAEKQNA